MMDARWDYGEAVRLIRNVRNDGTYPGLDPGAPLVRRGSIGYVVDVGTFLQDQIIYSVNFLDEGRIVGCREEELIAAEAPWIDSHFKVHQKGRATRSRTIRGELRVPPSSRGEVLDLEQTGAQGVFYPTHFDCLPGRPLLVPEHALEEWEKHGK